MKRLLLCFLLLMASPLSAQDTLRDALRHMERRTAIRVETNDRARLQGNFAGVIRDTLVLRQNEYNVRHIALLEIDSLWQSNDHGSRGAKIGAAGLGAAGAIAGVLYIAGNCESNESCSYVSGAAFGALLGALPGWLLGGIAGAATHTWHKLYPE